MSRPQAGIETPFLGLELDRLSCQLHDFLDRYDLMGLDSVLLVIPASDETRSWIGFNHSYQRRRAWRT